MRHVSMSSKQVTTGSRTTKYETQYILRDLGLWLRVKRIRDPGLLSWGESKQCGPDAHDSSYSSPDSCSDCNSDFTSDLEFSSSSD